MTFGEYESVMLPFFATFGTGEYPPARVKMVFDDVSDLTKAEFQRIVTNFCKTRSVKYPPLPTHFVEEANGQRKARHMNAVERLVVEAKRSENRPVEKLLEAMGANSLFEAVKIRNANQPKQS